MRIGLVLSKTPGYSETFFINKIKGLQEYGHEVFLFVQQKEASFSLCNVIVAPTIHKNSIYTAFSFIWTYFTLIFYPKPLMRFIYLELQYGRSIYQLLKNVYFNASLLKAQLDWIHFGFATLGLQREHVAKAIDAKMGLSLRGFDIAIYPLKHPECYSLLWNRVDKIHTISEDLLLKAYETGLPKRTIIKKITPAIDCLNFKNAIASYSDNNMPFKILTIGRLHWKKGYVDMLKALAIVKQNGLKFTYTILGEGLDYEKIAYAVHQFGLDKEVTFIGKVPHDKVGEYLSNTDIYLQYSISEGFCNAVLEAQAMGCLCIVSDAEGLPENVLHEQTGWVVPKYNTQKLADTIILARQLSKESKQQIRKSAQERVLSVFNLDQQAMAFNEFYIK